MFGSEWAQEDCSEAASAHTGYFIPRVFWETNLEYILQRFQPRHHGVPFQRKGPTHPPTKNSSRCIWYKFGNVLLPQTGLILVAPCLGTSGLTRPNNFLGFLTPPPPM